MQSHSNGHVIIDTYKRVDSKYGYLKKPFCVKIFYIVHVDISPVKITNKVYFMEPLSGKT